MPTAHPDTQGTWCNASRRLSSQDTVCPSVIYRKPPPVISPWDFGHTSSQDFWPALLPSALVGFLSKVFITSHVCLLGGVPVMTMKKSPNTKTSRQPPSLGVLSFPSPALVTCLGCILHAPAKLLCVPLVLLPHMLYLLVTGGHLLLQGALQCCQLPLPQSQLLLYPLLPL